LDVDGEEVPEPLLPRCFPWMVPAEGEAEVLGVLLAGRGALDRPRARRPATTRERERDGVPRARSEIEVEDFRRASDAEREPPSAGTTGAVVR
jgi:hypothetical protein